jgi:hypothetical protein
MTKHHKTKPNLSTAELAAGLQLSVRRVQQLVALNMPTASIEAAQAWRQAQPSVAGDSAETLRQHRIALLSEQTRKAKLAADEQEGLLVSRAHAEAEALHIGLAVKGALLALETTLPGALLGMRSYGEIRATLHREFFKALDCLASGELFRAAGVLAIVRQHYPDFTPTSEAERP